MNDSTITPLRLLFIGDVIGRAGRAALLARLPRLRQLWALDFVVVNGENAAGGFGITETICDEFLQAGADCVTLGNHAFDQREALVFIERQPRRQARRDAEQISIRRRAANRSSWSMCRAACSWTNSTTHSRRSSGSLAPVLSASPATRS